MLGQPFNVLCQPVPSELFQGLDDTGVVRPPPLLQEAPVGDLVCQRVLEGVFRLGEQPCLIEKLR